MHVVMDAFTQSDMQLKAVRPSLGRLWVRGLSLKGTMVKLLRDLNQGLFNYKHSISAHFHTCAISHVPQCQAVELMCLEPVRFGINILSRLIR